VWLCELRLWLSVVIESGETRMSAVTPLPNLDCNVRTGDALAGEAFAMAPSVVGPSAALLRLRARYARAAGVRKTPLRRALARDETRRALAAIDRELAGVSNARRERLLALRSPDLFGGRSGAVAARSDARALRLRAATLRRERRRIADGGALAFSFPSHFGHVHARGGFQLVIGNPPWVRLHNIPPAVRTALRARFSVFRGAAWDPCHPEGRAQTFAAQVDLAALFAERCVELAVPPSESNPAGTVALLLPAKLWRSLSGGGVRRLFAARTDLLRIEDWTDAPCTFDAAVYPSVVVAARADSAGAEPLTLGVRRRTLAVEWRTARERLCMEQADTASPWLLLPDEARRAFDLVRAHGAPLGESTLRRATLGVKCGCNEAFIVNATAGDAPLATVELRGRRGAVERTLLRPLLRGELVEPWRTATPTQAIVWTHDARSAPLAALPPGAARWLAPWRQRLRARSDLRGFAAWWTLFRTDAGDSSRTRVVWSDFGRTPRAAILAPGDPTVPLNSCYVLPCDDPTDALALAALLNGPLAAAWLNAIAEPARGGWHRYLAWTVALLPLPHDWPRARTILAPLAERALAGAPPTNEALLAAACQAYRVRREDVAPLIAWTS
jgi:hypothetical protein